MQAQTSRPQKENNRGKGRAAAESGRILQRNCRSPVTTHRMTEYALTAHIYRELLANEMRLCFGPLIAGLSQVCFVRAGVMVLFEVMAS